MHCDPRVLFQCQFCRNFDGNSDSISIVFQQHFYDIPKAFRWFSGCITMTFRKYSGRFRLYYDDISKVFWPFSAELWWYFESILTVFGCITMIFRKYSDRFRLHYDDILKVFRPFSKIVFEKNPAILQYSQKNFGFNRNLWQIMQI